MKVFQAGNGFALLVGKPYALGLPPEAGSLLAFGTGSVSKLGFEREARVIETWNRSFEAE